MMLTIPKEPNTLELNFNQLWNGSPCQDDRLWSKVELWQTNEGLRIRVEGPVLHEQKVPSVQKGTRVPKLWNYDVIEVFLVGPGHRYLEVELGAGGHWLVLSFDSIRHRENDYELLQPLFRHWKTEQKTWVTQITIPWDLIPENPRAINAFAIMAGKYLAYSPVPGQKPDFHQPDHYPAAKFY